MIAYGIGGLGADERVFSELRMEMPFKPLPWIPPKPNEPLSEYARRFSFQIDQSQPFILIGVSFGGILAIELNKYLKPEKTLLVSSAVNKFFIPVAFRVIGQSGLFKILPKFLLKPPMCLLNRLFCESEPKFKMILKSIISETNRDFLRWALTEIANWDNREAIKNLVLIHGTKDKLLSYPAVHNPITIQNGGHFMVLDRANEISEVIKKALK